jgi:hypothetical protein
LRGVVAGAGADTHSALFDVP